MYLLARQLPRLIIAGQENYLAHPFGARKSHLPQFHVAKKARSLFGPSLPFRYLCPA